MEILCFISFSKNDFFLEEGDRAGVREA